MRRTIPFIVIVLAVLTTTAWYLASRGKGAPAITIVAPKAGEIWQPGEERTISWNTKNIPPGYKIAITIRRVPSPPLEEEGQEFDPIIFTDLPNTGSTKWKISPMYPDGTYVLGISAYESIPVVQGVSAESATFTITHPKIAADLYPLYGDASWQASEFESFVIGTTTYAGASITSYTIEAGMDPGSIFTPFEKYYDKKLKALGWSVANDLAAGGHVGGQTGYRKDGQVILTRFKIDYTVRPKNAPSECPCNVTLSSFSTN